MATTKTVTQEQLDSCTRVIDEAKHEVFYLVASATDATVTYQVRFNKQYHRFSCQCKANQQGFTCWHMRAVHEAATQFANAKRDEAAAKARERLETWTRVMNAVPTHFTEAQIAADLYQPRPFSILR